jgi:hypothetical protein
LRCRADATAAAAAAAPPFVGWLLRCYRAAHAAAKLLPTSRCRHRQAAAKPPPTSRCRTDATATAAAAVPPFVVVIVSPHQTAAI